jgi:hypothetical protein
VRNIARLLAAHFQDSKAAISTSTASGLNIHGRNILDCGARPQKQRRAAARLVVVMQVSSSAAELDENSATARAENCAGAARLASTVRPLGRKDGEVVKRLARHGAAIGHARAGLLRSEVLWWARVCESEYW